MITKWNKADRCHRPNLHEARIDQEAKEGLDRPLPVEQAGPQMRPYRRPSKAGLKEPTTSSAASKQRVPSTTAVPMEVFTVAKHTMERLVGIPTKMAATALFLQRIGRRGVVLKLLYEMNMGRYLLGVY